MGSKKKRITEEITHNEIGEEIHILDGPFGKVFVKQHHATDFIFTGEEYCPECHILMDHQDGYWECKDCLYSITDEESEAGEGHPTLVSTYEDDYGEYYGSNIEDDDEY